MRPNESLRGRAATSGWRVSAASAAVGRCAGSGLIMVSISWRSAVGAPARYSGSWTYWGKRTSRSAEAPAPFGLGKGRLPDTAW